jgi:hypothetical protein
MRYLSEWAPSGRNGGNGYSTAWQAAFAALERYNPQSILSKNPKDPLSYGKEYGGLIYDVGGRYYYTEAVVGEKEGGVDPWKALSVVPAQARTRIVGDYHTHGGPNPIVDGEIFSGFHAGVGSASPTLMGKGDIQEARQDLVTYRANILNVARYTSFLGTPHGRFALYNASANGFVFSFSPDTRLLPRGAVIPAASYAR